MRTSHAHTPEPRAGSIRDADGRPADLFNVYRYPVTAICRTCEEEIQANSFFQPFKHGAHGRESRLAPRLPEGAVTGSC